MVNGFILTPYFLDEYQPGLRNLETGGWWVNEPTLPAGDTQERMIELYRPLAKLVADAYLQGNRPVSIAGDCCTTLAVLTGLQSAGLTNSTLIWFDAHGDFNTWETTPSGFLGGMPLAMLVGRGDLRIANSLGLVSQPEEQVILTDGRDLDPGERETLLDSRLNIVHDVGNLLEQPLPDGPLYVHFDADVLSPLEAPAMSYLAAGGPTADVLGQAFSKIAASGQLQAVSLSCWNPKMDTDGRSKAVVMDLLGQLVG